MICQIRVILNIIKIFKMVLQIIELLHSLHMWQHLSFLNAKPCIHHGEDTEL